jgi:lon-related putative ATP-dependent protease
MNFPSPLPADELYRTFDPADLPFETTQELPENEMIVGQDRAVDAIQFSIGIQHQGYNLFVLGPNGVGRQTTVKRFLEPRAAAEPKPDDWCYVYNFGRPYNPSALRLPAGRAVVFRDDMKKLVEELTSVIPGSFTSEEYQLQKQAIEEEFRGRHTEALDKLREEAKERKIALIQTPGGFAFAPLSEGGEVISPDDFMRLSTDDQKQVENEVLRLQEALQKIMQQMPNLQREMQSRIRQLNQEVAEFAVTPLIAEVRTKYEDLPNILTYLDEVKSDIVENFEAFVEDDEADGRRLIGAALGIASSNHRAVSSRYDVNVIADNDQAEGAPVEFLEQPRYQNLIGRIEHIAQMGALVTDFTLIKAGALHKANGGYLVIEALKLLTEPFAWEALKQALRKQEIKIESMGQVYSLVSTVSLDPEPIPLDVKVVLIGERLLYYLLSNHDPEFSELFKVSADFENEMTRDGPNALAYAGLIAGFARKEGLRPFDRTAVARVIEHGSRLVGDSEKLSTHMRSVNDLLTEADYWAGQTGRDVVIGADVQHALDMQIYRAGRVQERIRESIIRDQIFIDTQGAITGQVNGLSVYSLGGHSFGRPSRITARVRMGKGEVVDIERQVEMGGPIHSKGVMILAAFLGARYAAERPLSLSATLVFEQSYGGIEGDSASSAELFALLSALAEAPVRQGLAVTGSVNQRGQIQAIGGVNEKIEGFFDVCQARGLTGDQGVLIPAANIPNLMLRHDVVEAARSGQFQVIPIRTIDEGIALLTGIPAGELDETGDYPPDSINGRVVARLVAFAEKQREFAAEKKDEGVEAAGDEDNRDDDAG